MPVCVVHIRKVRMFVNKRGVLVNVGVRLSGRIMWGVLMPVVLVMHVGMGMLHRLVDMFVVVLLGRMQPDTEPHQRASRQ
jgi:hypothetical protein